MIEDKGTCSHQVSLPLHSNFIKLLSIFYKILYEITIQIVSRQSTILFINSFKMSRLEKTNMIIAQPNYNQSEKWLIRSINQPPYVSSCRARNSQR